MRVLGFEPKTYGLKERKLESLTPLGPRSYNPPENRFTTNFSKNDNEIQQDTTRIINR